MEQTASVKSVDKQQQLRRPALGKTAISYESLPSRVGYVSQETRQVTSQPSWEVYIDAFGRLEFSVVLDKDVRRR